MSRPKPPSRPDVIVVPHRPSRVPKGFGLPMLLLAVATVGLTVRAMNPDWRGLFQETTGRLASLFVRRPAAPAKTVVPPKPDLAVASKPAEAAPAKPVAPEPEKKAKAPDAWDDIRRDAEKAKAERAEAERLKEEADRAIANAPLPPPRRAGRAPDPAAIRRLREEMRRRAQADMARMQRDMLRDLPPEFAELQRDMDRFMREQLAAREQFFGPFGPMPRGAGGRPGNGLFDPLPGMDRMVPPLPGMDRMVPPPPQPGIREEAGEDVRDGVKRTWRRRIIVINPNSLMGF